MLQEAGSQAGLQRLQPVLFLYPLIPPLLSVTQSSVSRLRYLDLFNPTGSWILPLDVPQALSVPQTELNHFPHFLFPLKLNFSWTHYPPTDPSQTPGCPFNPSIPLTCSPHIHQSLCPVNYCFRISLIDRCPLILPEAPLVQVLITSHLDHHDFLLLLFSCD